MERAETIQRIMAALSQGNKEKAKNLLQSQYPPALQKRRRRSYSPLTCLDIFVRDGFIDRYSGDKLLFPGALRILSLEFPNDFPYHAHWKMDKTHIAYWELHPTVDHIVPVARGGTDDRTNLVTTSQLRNSAKGHWTLEELGWVLHAPGDIAEWDGLLGQSLEYVQEKPRLLDDNLLHKWHEAAVRLREREATIKQET